MKNIKQFFIRLIAYPFCVFLIISGYHMVFDTPNYKIEYYKGKALFSGFLLILIAVIYIVFDIAIIIKTMIKK
uniref:hypothetical protein n=1 Tax=Gelidibacter sp. TaxID=2018083 RepID=UPI00404A5155